MNIDRKPKNKLMSFAVPSLPVALAIVSWLVFASCGQIAQNQNQFYSLFGTVFIFFQTFFLYLRFSKVFRTVDFEWHAMEKGNKKHRQETRDRRLAEEALQRSNQLAEDNNEVFWLTDPAKDKMIYVSPAYEKIWGRTCESLYTAPLTNWLEAIHPEDRNRVLEAAWTKQVAGQYDEIYRIQQPNGSIRWIRDCAVPVRDRTGAIYRIAGMAEDITILEEKYCHLMENTGMPIFFFYHDGRVIFINRIGAQYFGASPAALVGKSLHELFPRSQLKEFISRIQKITYSSVGEQFEDNAPFPTGRRWFWLSLQSIKNEFGRPIGVQAICQDITKRKEVEQELVKTKQFVEQSARAKERLGVYMSQGIRVH